MSWIERKWSRSLNCWTETRKIKPSTLRNLRKHKHRVHELRKNNAQGVRTQRTATRTQRGESNPVHKTARISQPTESSTNCTSHYRRQYRPKPQPSTSTQQNAMRSEKCEGDPTTAWCRDPQECGLVEISARPANGREVSVVVLEEKKKKKKWRRREETSEQAAKSVNPLLWNVPPGDILVRGSNSLATMRSNLVTNPLVPIFLM